MQIRKHNSNLFLALIVLTAALSGTSRLIAQDIGRTWLNPKLSPEERAEMVLQQLTLDEKLARLHGNGMAHNAQWTMPLTDFANGGAGYVEGVKRLGIPPLVISDAAYGVRDSGANGRY
jgi:beta-glucosidase